MGFQTGYDVPAIGWLSQVEPWNDPLEASYATELRQLWLAELQARRRRAEFRIVDEPVEAEQLPAV